jgi:hypothetical protein
MGLDKSKAKTLLLVACLVAYVAFILIGRFETGHWHLGLLGLLAPIP